LIREFAFFMSGTEILISVLGGIALILWGCRMVRTGVLRAYGAVLLQFIGDWTDNRLNAAAAGSVVGTLLQSSTATALLVSPFVAQGAIFTAGALAVMLGADLGSAVAALVFSSGISAAWPLLLFAGYALHATFSNRKSRIPNIGRVLIGLGLLFLGLRTIGSAASDLSSSPVISAVIEATSREPLLALLTGALLTWAAYSSIAIVLFAAALTASAGLPAEQLFPFVLGINAGAALPALSATLGEPPATRRIPVGNLIFRFVGVAAALYLLPFVTPFITGLSENAGMQIILFHLAFNAALIPVFIGLTGPVAAITQRILPDPVGNETAGGPRYLDRSLLQSPSAALGAAARETLNMGGIVEDMLTKTIELLDSHDPGLRKTIEAAEERVDDLNDAIKLYLTELMRDELSEDDSQRAVDIITFTTNLEHIGDIIDKNLIELADKKRRHRLQFSDNGWDDLLAMHGRIMDTLQLSMNVFMAGRPDSARELIARKTELRKMELEDTDKHLERLRSGVFESMVTSSIHLDVIRDFKRINSHLVSVAYPVLERAGELRPSRLTKKSVRQLRQTEVQESQT
jgi:phosphate:Na+ symporter